MPRDSTGIEPLRSIVTISAIFPCTSWNAQEDFQTARARRTWATALSGTLSVPTPSGHLNARRLKNSMML